MLYLRAIGWALLGMALALLLIMVASYGIIALMRLFKGKVQERQRFNNIYNKIIISLVIGLFVFIAVISSDISIRQTTKQWVFICVILLSIIVLVKLVRWSKERIKKTIIEWIKEEIKKSQ